MRDIGMKEGEKLFVEQLNQKQSGAFHELFRKYYRSLVLFAMKYVGEQAIAEDIVQDLFIAIWEKKENFISYNSFRVFLYRSVQNTCLNAIKHRKVEEKFSAYTLLQPEESQNNEFDTTEDEIYRKLFTVVDELPARCREVFLLHLDGKKNEEIAKELHITVLTVKTQKKKAVSRIRQQMGHLFLVLLFLHTI